MTAEKYTHDQHARRRRDARPRGRGALAAGALAVALVSTGGTYALWSDQDSAGAGVLRAGDLDVALGQASWSETTPGVTGTSRSIDPADFLAMPGDTIVLRQDFVTTLVGDNLAGELTVHWNQQDADLPDGVTATYQVHDDDGAAVTGPVRVGEAVVLPEVPVGEASWSMTVEFVLGPDADVAYAEGEAPEGPTPLADLGEMVIDLHQMRSGPGLTL